jgi:thioredoxin reductase (NADPH)
MAKKSSMIIGLCVSGIFLLGIYSCLVSKGRSREMVVKTQSEVVARVHDPAQDAYQVVIIGSGPGGLTAGIYTSRSTRDTLVIEGDTSGGLLTQNPEVANWPGIQSISGYELMQNIRNHAIKTGCSFLSDIVSKVDLSSEPFTISTQGGATIKAQSLIIAMGTERRKLGCPGEREYRGRGVSACATCDAPFFKDKRVFVVGGGPTALTEAHHLSHHASEVVILTRGPQFKTIDPIAKVVEHDENVKIMHNHVLKEILGDGQKVTGVLVQDLTAPGKKDEVMPADGVFIAIGFLPRTKLFEGQLDLDGRGYIETHDGSKTSKDGVFAAGDIIHAKYQQANVAAADGCKAAVDCIQFLDLKAAGLKSSDLKNEDAKSLE